LLKDCTWRILLTCIYK